MLHILNYTYSDKVRDLAPLVLRVVTGLIFAMHGYQKLTVMGLPGVTGFVGTLGFPLPEVFALLLIAAELVGGIMLILGLFTRPVAKVLAFVSIIALVLVHLPNGFFMSSNGYEFILLLLGCTIAIALWGPGRYALDRKIFK